MKYYIVITPFFPTQDKFYGSYIYDQVSALRRQGKTIIILRPCSGFSLQKDYEYNGFKVYYFRCIDMPSYILNGLTDSLNRILFISFFRRVFDINIDIEVVHCHTSQCALYGNIIKELFPQCTSVIQYHDPDPFTILNGKLADKKWNLKYKIFKTVKKVEKFDAHVCVSKRVEENLLYFPYPSPREEYAPYLDRLSSLTSLSIPPLKVKKSIVLINGVDKNLFYIDKHIIKDSDRFIIGCIGNYIEWKRHKCLVDAIKILIERGVTDIRLKFVGNNPPESFKELKQYVLLCGMEKYVEYYPPFNHDQLRDFYNSINLFVLPSVFEGLGCVFLESWACGTPFISCRNQGIDDLILPEEKDLWLISKDNSLELADKIWMFKEKRYKQHLADSIDIDIQVKRFLENLHL